MFKRFKRFKKFKFTVLLLLILLRLSARDLADSYFNVNANPNDNFFVLTEITEITEMDSLFQKNAVKDVWAYSPVRYGRDSLILS